MAEVDRWLKVSQYYGKRLNNGNLKDSAIESLLAEYPSHGFVIDRREAREIFVKVDEPSPELVAVMGLLRQIARMTMSKRNESFAYFFSSELPSAASPAATASNLNSAAA